MSKIDKIVDNFFAELQFSDHKKFLQYMQDEQVFVHLQCRMTVLLAEFAQDAMYDTALQQEIEYICEQEAECKKLTPTIEDMQPMLKAVEEYKDDILEQHARMAQYLKQIEKWVNTAESNETNTVDDLLWVIGQIGSCVAFSKMTPEKHGVHFGSNPK